MRTTTGAFDTATADITVRPLTLVRMDFSSGIVSVNSGVSSVDYNGDTYLGVGSLGTIDSVQEGAEVRPYGLSLALSGIPTEYVSISLAEQYQGRDIKVYFALLDEGHQVINDPLLIFHGRMDYMEVDMGDTATIKVVAESLLADWDRPRVRRYNHEDQISEYPSDNGFEFVNQAAEKEVFWGRSPEVKK